MRHIFKFMLFVALGAMVFVSCEEDKFTEKDAMESLQTIDVAFTVQDGSSYAEGVEGATVKLLKDSASSSTVEKTTDGSGYVMFEDMKIGGDISVYVNKDNYTKAVFQVSTSTDSYRESQISKTLKIYPLDGDNLATVKGQLTIETDMTNRQREKLTNQQVKVINHGLESDVEKSFVGTTDSEGKYAVKVPVNADGTDDLEVKFPSEIDTTQTLAMGSQGMYDGTYKVFSKPAIYYSDNYNASDIPAIPSVVANIEAPNNIGSGFALGVEAKGTPFSSYSQIELIQGGSGYEKDTIVELSAGINGNNAEVMIDVNTANGDPDSSSIQDVYLSSNNGALYTSEPTLDLSDLGGSNAKIDIRFESEYLVYIEDYGTDYQNIPNVSATYKEYNGETIVKEIDEDLNNSNELKPGWGNDFNNYINLYDGSIYPDKNNAYDGDTLFVTKGLTELPELSISTSTGQQAIMKFDTYDISANDSTITDWYFEQNGAGYDPANPPAVTLTSLAGYGSGAEFVVEVDNDGTFEENDMVKKDGGQGYVRNVNDFRGTGYTGTHGGDNYSLPNGNYISNVGPGNVQVRSIYYGTGQRQEE